MNDSAVITKWSIADENYIISVEYKILINFAKSAAISITFFVDSVSLFRFTEIIMVEKKVLQKGNIAAI